MFEAFIARHRIRPQSAAVYRDMWNAFARFCASQGATLVSVSADELRGFVLARAPERTQALSDRYVWRLLRLIDRVIAFDAGEQGMPPNPAAQIVLDEPRWRFANAAQRTPLPACLTAEEGARLVAFVCDRIGRPAPGGNDWKSLRNRCAVAVQLGAGLTPGEARALTLDQVVVTGGPRQGMPWKLRVPGNGNYPERETPIAPWASRLLRYWLDARARVLAPSPWLLPGTRQTDKPWSKRGFEMGCAAVFEAAGLSLGQGGTYVLRHTFALRQLRAGFSDTDVAGYLGIQDLSLMARYRRILDAPVRVV